MYRYMAHATAALAALSAFASAALLYAAFAFDGGDGLGWVALLAGAVVAANLVGPFAGSSILLARRGGLPAYGPVAQGVGVLALVGLVLSGFFALFALLGGNLKAALLPSISTAISAAALAYGRGRVDDPAHS